MRRLLSSKRHSLQAVELSQRTQAAVQIVFWHAGHADPLDGWRCGSQKWVMSRPINPGPTTLNKKVWICDICHNQIHVRKQISIRCNRIEHWVHLRCAGIRQAQYTDTWTCHLHRESRLTPHTDITPPHCSRPLSKPPTHYLPTPPTPPQPKHRHMSNTPPVPTGLVKPKPNSLIHSPPSPLTPPRAKHIHMSHTPPTPLTSTSHVLHKHLNHVYHSYTNSPQPHLTRTPHQHCRHPRTLTLPQHTHMQHKQQYMHHSHRNNRTYNIGYYDNLTNRPRTTTELLTPHKHTGPAVKVREISQFLRTQKQTRGAQTAYSRHTCRHHHNSGNQAHP